MFKEISIESDSLSRYIQEMSKWGDFISEFYEPIESEGIVAGEKQSQEELVSLVNYILENNLSFGVDDIDFGKFNTRFLLNRYEFEGSLTSKYLTGGIYGSPTDNVDESRKIAVDVIEELFPKDSSLFIYKMDEDWSDFYRGWLNWTYIVNDRRQNRWWIAMFGSAS